VGRVKKRKSDVPQTWTPAGTLLPVPSAEDPVLCFYGIHADGLYEAQLDNVGWIEENRQRFRLIWVDVESVGKTEILQDLARVFQLHALALEDVSHQHQRPKVDIYEDHLFIALRMLSANLGHLDSEQLSLFVGSNFLVTFQDDVPGDCLEAVRNRLRKDPTRIASADFLAYQLVDAVVDSYFPLLEQWGDQLEQIEDDILLQPNRRHVAEIHRIKRDLLGVRRAVWPLREAVSTLLREETPIISKETRVYLKDLYDHTIQVVDLAETFRELSSGLMDIYLSSVSNKMNEVMKILTMITTIFVPLTFVAGLYGMNFNTEKSPWNMPELNARYGYPLCLLFMALLAAGEMYYFWGKGWLSSGGEHPSSAPSTQSQSPTPSPPSPASSPTNSVAKPSPAPPPP